jgi:hypothetical protein
MMHAVPGYFVPEKALFSFNFDLFSFHMVSDSFESFVMFGIDVFLQVFAAEPEGAGSDGHVTQDLGPHQSSDGFRRHTRERRGLRSGPQNALDWRGRYSSSYNFINGYW